MARVQGDGRKYRSGKAANRGRGSSMYTLIGIGLLVAVAMLSNEKQRKGAWLLAAVVVVLVFIADRLR
jgi:Na+/H+ antiporter NhaC